MASFPGILALSLFCLCCFSFAADGCLAGQVASDAPGTTGEATLAAAEYRTPLAGEPGHAVFLGRAVPIPGYDRGHMTSLTLGAGLLQPRQGGTAGVPIGVLYLRRFAEHHRFRGSLSLLVNELEYDRRFGNFEMVGYLENRTLPFDQTEEVDGREIKATSLVWGDLDAAVGPGFRLPVAPFEVDNDLRLQFLGSAGFFYAKSTDRSLQQVLPPDTMTYGGKFKARYDGLRRNVLELAHSGWATGLEASYQHRDRWRDLAAPGIGAARNFNRDFLQLSGYFVAAAPVPGLSERNRLVMSLYGATIPGGRGDRFNAFRINGGPFPTEGDDLARPHYSGILYEDVLATRYATLSLGYRRELAFFVYLSLLGSYIWADRATVLGGNQVGFRETSAAAGTVSLDCAFFWNSSFYLGYAWESGLIRGGRPGSGFLLLWNKMF